MYNKYRILLIFENRIEVREIYFLLKINIYLTKFLQNSPQNIR